MTTEDRQLKLRKFLESAAREDLVERTDLSVGQKVWAQAPWGSVQINPHLGTVELKVYRRDGVPLLGEGEESRLESLAREVGSGHWIHGERNAGVRNLNSDF